MMQRTMRLSVKTVIALATMTIPVCEAAVLVSEEFGSDPGWTSRDGEMAVSWNSLVGDPAGSIRGSFVELDVPFPEIDAFHIDNTAFGGPWTGDYGSLYPGYTQFVFDFLAEDVLPSSLVLQISDGLNTFIRNLLPQVASIGGFLEVTVPLSYDGSWLGGSAGQFAAMMGNVTFVDVQIARFGAAAQDYFIDNFSITDEGTTNPPLSAVPESSIVQLGTITLVILIALHRRLRRRTPLQRRPT